MIVREFANVGQGREIVPAYWLRFREFFDFLKLSVYNIRKKGGKCRKIVNITS